jgi:aspartyl-tRNA synthetase
MVIMICREESIREVIGFPKNNRGLDLMSRSPSDVDPRQLRDLGIKLAGDKPPA